MEKRRSLLYGILTVCILLLFTFLLPNFVKVVNQNLQAIATQAVTERLTNAEIQAKQLASQPKYDPRGTDALPSVRNQGATLLCWAYSAIAATEINLIKHGYKDKNIAFSPQNLSYNLNNRQDDPLHNTYEDVYDNIGYNIGGWADLTGDILTQWRGLGTTNYLGYDKNEFILKELTSHTSTDPDTLKQLVATYGSVVFEYEAPSSSATVYYNNTSTVINHASVIVGWDDTIAKDRFYPHASQDGAWIVRNSWGSSAHSNGYFYLSYDSNFYKPTVFDYVKSTEYDNNYFYDANSTPTIGIQTFYNNQDYFKMGNIFEVKKNTATNEELLKAVNIGVIGQDITAEIEVYTQLPSLQSAPNAGTVKAKKTVFLPREGYYTIDLDIPISLDGTQFYSIVVKLTNAKKDAALYSEISNLSTYDFCYHYNIAENVWKPSKEVFPTKTGRIKGYTINRARTSTPANDLAFATVESTQPYTVDYNEQQQYPSYKVTFNNKVLSQDTDYTITYTNNKFPGIAQALIKGTGQYTGQKLMTWQIIQPDNPPNLPGEQDPTYLSTKRVFHVASNVQYYNQIALPVGWSWLYPDYAVQTGENRNNYVQYYDTINYKRSMYDAIVIKEQSTTVTDISTANVTLNATSFVYTGNAITPQVTVTVNSTTLTENVDYILQSLNNTDVGQATLTIIGIGHFNGSLTKNFTIIPADKPISTPPTSLTIASNADLNTALGEEWKLQDESVTILEGETKTVIFELKKPQNYTSNATVSVQITRSSTIVLPPTPTPIPKPDPIPTPDPTPQPKPPIVDIDASNQSKTNIVLITCLLIGGVLFVAGIVVLIVLLKKR